MRDRDHTRNGFTYVEVLVAMAVSAFVLTSAYAAIFSLARGSESMVNYSEMNSQTRRALEMLGRDARMARDVQAAGATYLMLEREISGTTYDVYYAYLPNTGTFSRTVFKDDDEDDPAKKTLASVDDAQSTYLYDVDVLTFTYYNFRQGKTDHTRDIKHIQIEGVLERRLLSMFNTNYIISTRFMMRNKDVTN